MGHLEVNCKYMATFTLTFPCFLQKAIILFAGLNLLMGHVAHVTALRLESLPVKKDIHTGQLDSFSSNPSIIPTSKQPSIFLRKLAVAEGDISETDPRYPADSRSIPMNLAADSLVYPSIPHQTPGSAVPQLLQPESPGRTADRNEAGPTAIPGDPVPGDQVLEGQVPGDPVLGDQVPGDQVLGGQVPGDPVLGDQVPGDPVLGGQKPGDPVLGGQVPGDPVLGIKYQGFKYRGVKYQGIQY
eukprot:jgi/Botrbrau1/1978/Bobra.0052s0021.1